MRSSEVKKPHQAMRARSMRDTIAAVKSGDNKQMCGAKAFEISTV